MKDLFRRSLTGIIYVVVIVALVSISRMSLMLLQLLLICAGLLEFRRLSTLTPRGWLITVADLLGGILMLCAVDSFLGVFHLHDFSTAVMMPLLAMTIFGASMFLVYIIARLLLELYRGDERPISSLAHSFLGQLYIALPVSLMMVVYDFGGAPLVLAMFIMIWLNDTGAYCVGSLFGRHRLFERVSPKKSWEGFFGGMAFGLLSVPVFKYCFPDSFSEPIWWYLAMAVIVSIFGTWGDLVESMMKRALHVKESGNILPGHGGLLDRIDSLLLVLPAMTLFIALTYIVTLSLS